MFGHTKFGKISKIWYIQNLGSLRYIFFANFLFNVIIVQKYKWNFLARLIWIWHLQYWDGFQIFWLHFQLGYCILEIFQGVLIFQVSLNYFLIFNWSSSSSFNVLSVKFGFTVIFQKSLLSVIIFIHFGIFCLQIIQKQERLRVVTIAMICST